METVIKISEVLHEFVRDMALKRNPEDDSQKLAGIETGFDELDRMTSGLRRGSLIVIASRPSMGKTTLALNIASHMVLNSKLPALMFRLECSAIEMAMRLISQVGNIETQKLQTGVLDEFDHEAVNAAIVKMQGLPLYIDESPAQTVDEIISACHEVRARNGELGLVVIDDLQSIGATNRENRGAEGKEEVMSFLKTLALEVDAPVILLSQLEPHLEERAVKRPQISDLPERIIAQWSDLLLFLYRDQLYNPDSKDEGKVEVIIGRNRYGPIGTIILDAKKLCLGSFSNACAEDYPKV